MAGLARPPGELAAEPHGAHGRSQSLRLTLPPLATLVIAPKR